MELPPSDHFNGKTFFQEHHGRAWRRLDLLRWRLSAKPKAWPRQVALTPRRPPMPQRDEVVVTWLGHASFLIQSAAANILVDPVFSHRVSPVSWMGPARVHPPPVALAALPSIDVVLLSHDHYDHFDQSTVRALVEQCDPCFVAPLRHGDLLEAAGARNVTELDWWQTARVKPDVTVTLTPTKHWSNRLGTPRNHRLWGGFFLHFHARPTCIWFVGDTGYDAAIFRDVRKRGGPPDLALVPIGAYEPRWFMAPMHLNPAEAVQLHQDVDARRSIAMHWGTFQLSDEGRDDPVIALEAARAAADLKTDEFVTIEPGASVTV